MLTAIRYVKYDFICTGGSIYVFITHVCAMHVIMHTSMTKQSYECSKKKKREI